MEAKVYLGRPVNRKAFHRECLKGERPTEDEKMCVTHQIKSSLYNYNVRFFK